jgi:hypothetical protein
MLAMSGDVGSVSRHFDLSYSAHLYGSIGMTADFSVVSPFYFEALPRAVTGNNS